MSYLTLRMIDEIYENIIKIKQDILKIQYEVDGLKDFVYELNYDGDVSSSETSSDDETSLYE